MANIVTVHSYAGMAREIAKRIKNPTDDPALTMAAEEMAEFVPEGAILVPTPSSTGKNRAMLVLSQYIAQIVPGASVIEAVDRISPMPSKALLRQAGRKLPSFEDQVASMELKHGGIPDGSPIWIVDNVVTSGDTIRAMESVIGRDVNAIVYAQAGRGRHGGQASKNPPATGRICVSGSRTYRNLGNVAEVLKTIPAGSIIVHGGAEGVDRQAAVVALDLGLGVDVWRAEWERYGRRAGPIRNRAMVASCDFLYAFWDGVSRGTASAIQAALDQDIPFEIVEDI